MTKDQDRPVETEAPETVDAASVPDGMEPTTMQRARRWARRHLRQLVDHLWGPTGSVILHLVILYALIHWVSFAGREAATEVEVMVVDPETIDLEDIIQELDELTDPEIDIAPPEAQIMMETPPDVQRRDPVAQDDIAALDIRTDVQSPLVMRGLISGRTASGRGALLQRFAGRRAQATEAAVLRALEWLKAQQLEDGSWRGTSLASNKTSMTGLGLLTFLAHGQTPNSERYGPTVERAIRFLLQDLAPPEEEEEEEAEEGQRFRLRAGRRGAAETYAHGIATYALAEAFALTRIPSIRPILDDALLTIIEGQQRHGGFSYGLRPDDTRRDTSVMSWMAQAMKAAFIAGVDLPGLEETMEQTAEAFKMNVGRTDHMFAYAPGGADPTSRPASGRWSNTAQAILGLQLLGHGQSPEVRRAIPPIADQGCEWFVSAGSYTLYNWYYHTQAMFHHGGTAWESWNRQFSAAYLSGQNTDGSFTPFNEWERRYGPVYGTVFSALSLTVYYRFLPTYQPIAVESAPTQESEDDVVVEIF